MHGGFVGKKRIADLPLHEEVDQDRHGNRAEQISNGHNGLRPRNGRDQVYFGAHPIVILQCGA